MDLYPMGSPTPYRIELFDDEIESLRIFAPDTQLSTDKVQQVRLLPGREYPLHPDAIAGFRQAFRAAFDVDVRRCPLYDDISKGLASAGIEYYLPLFFPDLVSLFSYLPDTPQCLTFGEIGEGAEQFWREIRSRFEERSIDRERPILPPERLFLSMEELYGALKPLPQLQLHSRQIQARAGAWNLPPAEFPDLAVDAKAERPMARLESFLREHPDQRVLFCCDSAGRREALLELLRRAGIDPR